LSTLPENLGTTPLLTMRGISKRFAGVLALDNVDFTVRAGEIHALMGENGAGKSTLLKVLTGVYTADGGRADLNGKRFAPANPKDAQEGGVSTVYQEVNLIPQLSVAENICLGRQPRVAGFINHVAERRRAVAALARLGLKIDVGRTLASYSIAIQQMVAIARALDVQARLLVLDEPTSSLDAGEVARLFEVMRRLRSDGLGIVFVTHFLDQVYEVTDRITVLRNGKLVGEFETAALPKLQLVAKMLGREEWQDEQRAAAAEAGATAEGAAAEGPAVVQAYQVRRRGALEPTDVVIRRGEALGLVGLLGSGRTELARLLFAADRLEGGRLEVSGKRTRIASPRAAISRGFGFSSEDRKTEGIIPELSIRENTILALQAKRGWWRKIWGGEQRKIARRYIAALNVATPNEEKPIGQLSGGNQQKVLLARWLACNPVFLILDEPTRGIDIGAKREIEKLTRKLVGEGMAVLFISSELDEVLRSSDRLAVLRDRRKIAELPISEATEAGLMKLMAEGAAPAQQVDAN